jgi:hypothetical protein
MALSLDGTGPARRPGLGRRTQRDMGALQPAGPELADLRGLSICIEQVRSSAESAFGAPSRLSVFAHVHAVQWRCLACSGSVTGFGLGLPGRGNGVASSRWLAVPWVSECLIMSGWLLPAGRIVLVGRAWFGVRAVRVPGQEWRRRGVSCPRLGEAGTGAGTSASTCRGALTAGGDGCGGEGS